MRYISLYSIIVILASVAAAFATWESNYGWIFDEAVFSLKITRNKDYVVCGSCRESEHGADLIFVSKANSSGDSLWAKKYGGGIVYDIIIASDDGYVIAGYKTMSMTVTDYYLFKTNIDGDTLWTHNYGLDTERQNSSIKQTNDNGFIIVWGLDPTENNIFVMRTDSIGDTIWTRTIGYAPWDEWGNSVVETSDSGYIIGGTIELTGDDRDAYFVKLNKTGDMIWESHYGGIGNDWVYYISKTTDGNIIATGHTTFYYSIRKDVYLLKVNEDGDTLWTRKYGGLEYNDYGRCVKQTTDGGYIITGWTYSYGIGTPDNSNVVLCQMKLDK